MKFETVDQAITVLSNATLNPGLREEAMHYLSEMDDCFEIDQLINLLLDDEFNVRWEAARLLTSMGELALPSLLRALVDPEKVSHTRLREGVYRILHNNHDPSVQNRTRPLMNALRGPAPDFAAMCEASRLLLKMDHSKNGKNASVPC